MQTPIQLSVEGSAAELGVFETWSRHSLAPLLVSKAGWQKGGGISNAMWLTVLLTCGASQTRWKTKYTCSNWVVFECLISNGCIRRTCTDGARQAGRDLSPQVGVAGLLALR
jgi:hypothetical protein